MRTYTHLVCDCGHRGCVKLSENDQPYSQEWSKEEYIDSDLRNQHRGVETSFAAEGMKCPACGA